MDMGVSLSTFASAPDTANAVEQAVVLARQAAAAGVGTVWFGQMFSYDALMLAAIVGREVPGITVGTSVVPVHPRHPLLLASAAKTAQAATGGRLVLGIGLSSKAMVEPTFGVSYPPPVRHLREYLAALGLALAGKDVSFEGDTVVSRPPMPTALPGADPVPPVIVAAMGPQALRVAGELADGTLPFLAGPRTLAEHIVPAITRAAREAGRPAPRIIAAVPAVVTANPDAVLERAARDMAFYETIPSYQRVLSLEGVQHASDLFVAGDEDTVAAAVGRYRDAGATAVTLTQTDLDGDEARLRTWALAGELART
jgi:F420-dependent oxidoreductase-like protein